MDAEDLPPGWAWATLGELGFWTGGGTPSKAKPEYWQGGTVPWVSPKDMKRNYVGREAETITPAAVADSATKMVAGGSLLCVIRSGILNHTFPVALAECDLTINQDMRALTTYPGISADYVSLFLKARNSDILHTCAKDGTTVASIEMRFLQELPVPIAPSTEQARIADAVNNLFAELDEAEAALTRARDSAEQFRASLLHAACAGQLTASWREENPAAETGTDLLHRVLAERRAAWERRERARLEAKGTPPRSEAWKARYEEPTAPNLTDMLDLPAGWTAVPLRLLVVEGPTNGYSPKISRNECGTLSLKLTATTKGVIDLSTRATKRLSEQIDANSYLFLKDGDLLFQRGNTPEYVGIAAIFRGPENAFVYPDLMIRVRASQGFVAEWLWRVANSPYGRRYMQATASGTAGTMPKITGKVVQELMVPLPPEAELCAVLSVLSNSFEVARDADEQLENIQIGLSQLRQSILHAAFTGRLVPQDPGDEPFAVLLARLRASTTPAGRTRGRRAPAGVSV